MRGNNGTGWGRPLRTEPAMADSARPLDPAAKSPKERPLSQTTKTHHQPPAVHSLGAPVSAPAGDGRSTEAVGARLALAKREGRRVSFKSSTQCILHVCVVSNFISPSDYPPCPPGRTYLIRVAVVEYTPYTSLSLCNSTRTPHSPGEGESEQLDGAIWAHLSWVG